MDTEYDFIQTINATQLLDEIGTAALPAPDYITSAGNTVQIFYVNALSSDQIATLTNVVASHVANPNYISLDMQTQISTLISYLNNSNSSICSIARATMIANLAPRLPYSLLVSINNQIASTISS